MQTLQKFTIKAR